MKTQQTTTKHCTESSKPESSFEWPKDTTSVEAARKHLQVLGAYHAQYSFYTSVERVIQMLETGFLWLTRLDSELFDDGIEHRKYGKKSVSSRLFIKCFQFGPQENAAMWGLYCPPTYQAIRVTISGCSIGKLAKSSFVEIRRNKVCKSKTLSRILSWVQDIVYASVASRGSPTERSNILWHDGERSRRISNLDKQISRKRGTGIVKDVEWMFENEARLFAKTNGPRQIDHIAVKLPEEVVESMSFVLSPWATERECGFVRSLIEDAFKNGKWKRPDSNIFSNSVLQGGLRLRANR